MKGAKKKYSDDTQKVNLLSAVKTSCQRKNRVFEREFTLKSEICSPKKSTDRKKAKTTFAITCLVLPFKVTTMTKIAKRKI